jgi:hypothetical protein
MTALVIQDSKLQVSKICNKVNSPSCNIWLHSFIMLGGERDLQNDVLFTITLNPLIPFPKTLLLNSLSLGLVGMNPGCFTHPPCQLVCPVLFLDLSWRQVGHPEVVAGPQEHQAFICCPHNFQALLPPWGALPSFNDRVIPPQFNKFWKNLR